MKPELPEGTRAERIAFARQLMRERRAEQPAVRLTRRSRRAIVAGQYLLLLATVAGAAAGPNSILIWAAVPLVLFYLLVSYSVRGLLLGGSLIDERERALRDRATALAYRVVTAAISLVIGYFLIDVLFHAGLPVPATAPEMLWLLVPLSWLALTLPPAILAWTLPDPHE